MISMRRFFGMIICVGVIVSLARGAEVPDKACLARGKRVRAVLLGALEKAYQKDGVWPAELGAEEGMKLVYTPPVRQPNMPDDPRRTRHVASVTVVVEESLADHPDGVWVGYADGHLEFAPDAARLADCKAQIKIVEGAAAADAPVKKPLATTGELAIKVIDSDGHAATGALVGIFTNFGNSFPEEPRVTFAEAGPAVADAMGRVTLGIGRVFDAKFSDQPSVPLFFLDEVRGLAGELRVYPSDFGAAGAPAREIRLAPACRVTGEITGVDLPNGQRSIQRLIVLPFVPGNERMYTQQCVMKGATFETLLPAGDYGLNVYGTGSDPIYRFIHVAAGQRLLRLNLDLPPSTITRLTGQAAPEFEKIKGWKNSPPLTMAGLRGHPVVLDFWGYWCGPCCEAMPGLMKLYDAYKDKGVVVVAVHDDSAGSLKELEEKLAPVRQKFWAGRDVPFAIALDGGGKTRIRYTAMRERGATTAAYGINSFPTTLLVGSDGRIVGDFDPENPKDIAKLESLLGK